jgi:hypothetical protein
MGDGQSSTHSWSKPPWQSSSTGDVLLDPELGDEAES